MINFDNKSMISKEIQQSDQWGKDLKKLDRREWDDTTYFFFLVASHTGKNKRCLEKKESMILSEKDFDDLLNNSKNEKVKTVYVYFILLNRVCLYPYLQYTCLKGPEIFVYIVGSSWVNPWWSYYFFWKGHFFYRIFWAQSTSMQ